MTDRETQPRVKNTKGWFQRLFVRVRRVIFAFLPILIGLFVASGLDQSGTVTRLQNLVFDQYQRWYPRPWNENGPVRIVDVDDQSLVKLGQWPWPHDTFAKILKNLTKAGAAVVAFDVVFADKDRLARTAILERLPALPERETLAKAMRDKGLLIEKDWLKAISAAPVVLGFVLSRTGQEKTVPAKWGVVFGGDNPRRYLQRSSAAILPLAEMRPPAKGLGAFNMAPDQDIIVRRVPMFFLLGDEKSGSILPSLSAEALRVAQRASTYIIKSSNASGETAFGEHTGIVAVKIGQFETPTGKDGTVRIHFSGSKAKRYIPAWKILDGSFDPKDIAGRIILIGASATAVRDIRSTPLQQSAPGVDVHAEVIEQIIAGQHLVRPDYARGLELWVLLIGALLLVFAAEKMRATTASIVTLVLLASAAGASWLAFRHGGYLFDPLIPGATWLATAAVALMSAYRRTEREKQFVRGAFSRYLSPAIVERIAADPSQLSLGGETRNVTILFSDVRNFTPRAEQLDAEGVVAFLNALHTPFTGEVLKKQGTIDKYIGDGLMAFWNAPLDVADHANLACAAALAMQDMVPAIDAKLRISADGTGVGHLPLKIGIGINTGDAFVGNMGSDQRFDYSIVGDPVNIAARLEAATKEFGVPIIVSRSTRDAADQFIFVDLGAANLKGKTSETSAFALHCAKSEMNAELERFLALHDSVVEAAGNEAGKLEAKIALARAHPASAAYQDFYRNLLEQAAK